MNWDEIWPKIRRYVLQRDRTIREIHTYLKTKHGFSTDLIHSVVEKLIELDFLNEARFAENRIRYRLQNAKGPLWVRQELRTLGISSEVIEEKMNDVEPESWTETAYQLAEEKLKQWMQKEDCKDRIRRFLIGRGFPGEMTQNAVRQLEENYPHWSKRSNRS